MIFLRVVSFTWCQLWFPGETPLDVARRRDRTEIVTLLTGA